MPSLFTHPPKITSLREGQALTDRMAAIQNQAERAKWLPLEVPRADNQNISAAESARNKRDQLIGGGIVGAGAMVTPSTPAQGQPAPSLFTQRPSGAQQWESAIQEQRQRDLRKPSMGQQVADIITGTGGMMLSPLTNLAGRMGEAYQGGIDWNDPAQVGQMGGKTVQDMLMLGAPGLAAAERGAVGALGGMPTFTGVPGIAAKMTKADTAANVNMSAAEIQSINAEKDRLYNLLLESVRSNPTKGSPNGFKPNAFEKKIGDQINDLNSRLPPASMINETGQ